MGVSNPAFRLWTSVSQSKPKLLVLVFGLSLFWRWKRLLGLPRLAGPLQEHVDPSPHRVANERKIGGQFVALSHGLCHYRVDGSENSGRLVVLVHGMAGSQRYFRYLTKHLVENLGRRVLRFDNYGRGCSSSPASNHTASLFSSQLAELLLHLPRGLYGLYSKIDLIGYSLGGGIVAKFASVHGPNLINSLTMIAPVGAPSMVDSPLWRFVIPVALRLPGLRTYLSSKCLDPGAGEFTNPNGARFKDFARRFRQRAQSERRTLPAAFLSSLAWFPMGGLEDAFRTIGNTQLAANRKLAAAAGIGVTPDAPKFSFPVCLIWGEDDHTCPVAGAYEIANFIPRAEVHVLQGHRHCVAIEHEGVVGGILASFWGKQQGNDFLLEEQPTL